MSEEELDQANLQIRAMTKTLAQWDYGILTTEKRTGTSFVIDYIAISAFVNGSSLQALAARHQWAFFCPP